MRILLTGKEGQVGFELRRALALLGEVHAIDVADCDLGNEAAIRRMVQGLRPDVIVNPAAYTAVDKAESEPALAANINAHAPGILALEAERLGAMLVHFSTDYVFDGKKNGAYNETDTPNPKSVYGVTKLAGEHAVQRLCTRHVILRTSWVVGAHGNNFAKTMLRLAAERDELNVVSDQCGTPTSAALLADLTAHLVRQASQPTRMETGRFPYGLYHATASGSTNWHAYASYVIERARAAGQPVRVAPDAIKPIATEAYPTPARRPANSQLDTTKLRETFGLHLPSWQAGVDHILDQLF
ncbi:dTDP-4-dehydrorhamnose reductase [Rhodoferax sp.]|uniref:dTDP-4-dehydrorhamnose reductase n=1 Tax=Rhodoferax sp. TaxID=50421 RepID=UPI002628486B|nr:dTDP-4-dehydrorhamnose reductase [Rhodoferax sp.]MDD3935973.1 dTDP-4-dehydrorhamnose reductase [Rhodoferax sp.]